MRSGEERVYRVPDTTHWAGWRNADAVVEDGALVACRTDAGHWAGASGERLERSDIGRYAKLKSIGISTR